MIDPTKYFVCKACGDIHLKKDAIATPRLLRFLKTAYGDFKYEHQYCPNCIDVISWVIAREFACIPATDLILDIVHHRNQLHSVLITKIEDYLKQWGYPYSTIDEYVIYEKKQEQEFQEKLEKIRSAYKANPSWWRNLWSKK